VAGVARQQAGYKSATLEQPKQENIAHHLCLHLNGALQEGLLALYKGWTPSVLGVIPYVGLNFAGKSLVHFTWCSHQYPLLVKPASKLWRANTTFYLSCLPAVYETLKHETLKHYGG
jgi:hypothetical protein